MARSSYAVSAISALLALAFVEAFAFGLMAPMLPILTTEYFARTHQRPLDPAPNCAEFPHLEACIRGSKEAGWWSSVFSSAASLCTFFSSPIVGQASDDYGRKPFIVLSQLIRLGYPVAIMNFAELGGSIWPYYIINFVAMALGTMGIASAAIADVVTAEHRAATFGYLFAAFTIGYSLGAGISPIFTQSHILMIAAFLYCFRVAWAILALPETLPMQRPGSRPRKLKLCRNPLSGFSILFRTKLFVRLTLLVVLTSFVANGVEQIRLYYLNTVVSFTEKDIAHLMLLSGICSICAQGLLLRLLLSCMSERGVIVVALLAQTFEFGSYVLISYLQAKWIIYGSVVGGSIGVLSFSAISSLKSMNCTPQEQGKLQGAIYGARAVFDAIGPLVYASLYAAMSPRHRLLQASPFLLSMALYLTAVVLACWLPVSSTASEHPKHGGFSPRVEEVEEADMRPEEESDLCEPLLLTAPLSPRSDQL